MITDMATVKTLARIPDVIDDGEPTGSGGTGDVYLDRDTGLTYEWDGIGWQLDTSIDDLIERYIERVEKDFLRIRGVPFDEDELGIVYPDGADTIAAEMVCYLAGLGDFEGRNLKSENIGGRNATFDDKIRGYPAGIVEGIERYVRAL